MLANYHSIYYSFFFVVKLLHSVVFLLLSPIYLPPFSFKSPSLCNLLSPPLNSIEPTVVQFPYGLYTAKLKDNCSTFNLEK